MINGDDDDPNDGECDLEDDEEGSLGPDEYDAFELPLEVPQLKTSCKRLASKTKSIKKKSQHLKTEEDELNNIRNELLRAEQARGQAQIDWC